MLKVLRSAVLAVMRGVHTIEAFEQAGQVLGGDTVAGVGHRYRQRIVG